MSTATQFGSENSANVFQDGDRNTSTVNQPGFDNEIGGLTLVGINQVGDDNVSTATQGANFGLITVDQIGDNLTSTATQIGRSNSSVIDVDQAGSFNSSTVLQTAPAPADGGPGRMMTANVVQSGSGNDSFITQTNELGEPDISGNLAEVTQTGFDNHSDVFQNGHENTATVEQNGTGGMSDVHQMGDNNTTTVTQN